MLQKRHRDSKAPAEPVEDVPVGLDIHDVLLKERHEPGISTCLLFLPVKPFRSQARDRVQVRVTAGNLNLHQEIPPCVGFR